MYLWVGEGGGAMLNDKLASVNIVCFDVSCFSSSTKCTRLGLA